MIIRHHNNIPDLQSVLDCIKKVNDPIMYNHNGGAYNPANSMEYAEILRSKINKLVNHPIQTENCYAWDWMLGGTMQPHTDREGLDWTITMPLSEESSEWPIWAEGYGEVKVPYGSGFLLSGRKISHWRNDCPTKRSTWIMYHYREIQPQNIEIHRQLLSPYEIGILLNEKHLWVEATTQSNRVIEHNYRKSKVSWLDNEQYAWLYNRVDNRMHNIRNDLDKDYYERLQLTKYNEGGFFKIHADNGDQPMCMAELIA